MSNRTIILAHEEIDADVVKDFLETFAELDSTKGPIEVRICSPGGWVEGGFAMYDTMRLARNKVTTVGVGIVGSMGVLLLQGGDERLMTENSTLYLHPMQMATEGSIRTVARQVGDCARHAQRYEGVIAARSKQELESISLLCKEDTYMPAQTAVDLRLADRILTRKKTK